MTIPLPLDAHGSEVMLPGARLAYQPAWLPLAEADALFGELQRSLPWSVHRIRVFGRGVDSPRLSAWIGDADAVYRYSGSDFEPYPWIPALIGLRQRLQDELDTPFNSVLANLYRDGRDAMGGTVTTSRNWVRSLSSRPSAWEACAGSCSSTATNPRSGRRSRCPMAACW